MDFLEKALMISLLLTILHFAHSFHYKNEPFHSSSGILYDKIGTAHISNSALTLLSHLNISFLNAARSNLHKYYNSTKSICETIMKSSPRDYDSNKSLDEISAVPCDQALSSIWEDLENIKEKSEILRELTKNRDSYVRSKRGAFNAVGTGLKWAIGIPDADDAQYYTDSINMLVNNNKQTQTLLKSQVQIISSTIKNFNSSFITLIEEETILNTNIKKINKFMEKVSHDIEALKVNSIILRHISRLQALSNKISQKYSQYIDAINFGKHNILLPIIITPNVLIQELKMYRGDYDLLVDPEYDASLLYEIMNLQLVFREDIIIFAIRFPLVTKMKFNLHHLIPLPIQHSNTTYFSYIEPKNKYLLISQSKLFYSNLQDLTECSEYLPGRYVCFRIHVIKSINQPSCEVRLLAPHTDRIPSDCQTETILAIIETWKYINNNKWIYVLQQPTTLTITCDSDKLVEDVVIHQTGIVILDSGCKGYTSNYNLEPQSYADRNLTYYVPTINIVEQDCCVHIPEMRSSLTQKLQPIHLTNVDLNELKFAASRLDEFDDIISRQMNRTFIITHLNWYTIALIIAITMLFLYFFYKYYSILGYLRCCPWKKSDGHSCTRTVVHLQRRKKTADEEIAGDYDNDSSDYAV